MPRKSKTGFSLPYQSVEDMGFSSTHRRDSIENFDNNTFSVDIKSEFVETQQLFTDLGLTGDKIESLSVGKLTAGTIYSEKITLGVINASGDVWINAGKTDFNDTLNTGFILGLDDSDNNEVKFHIGSISSYLDWNVTTADTLTIVGSITATSGDIGGWTITSGYIYNLQSGTPTALPNDGIVLASGNESIIVYEDTAKRIELGYLSAGVYGLKGYATDGTTVLFELSDTQVFIAGFTPSATTLANGTDIILDASNKAISINNATFGSDGIQLQYNAGNPRAYIGDGANNFMQFDGASFSASGNLVSQQSYTSGQLMDAGSVGAIESDGLLYRSRWTNFSTENTGTSFGVTTTNPYTAKSKLLNISSTRKAFFYSADPGGVGTTNFKVETISVTPTGTIISSVASTNISDSGAAQNIDTVLLTTTTAAALWTTGGGSIHIKYVASLDGTPSLGARATFSTAVASKGEVCMVKISATEVLVFYADTSNNIRAVPVTLSGTTFTFGSAQTVLTASGSDDFTPICAETFLGTTYHAIYYVDGNADDAKMIAIEYSSSTVTPGSPIDINTGITIGSSSEIGSYLAPTNSATVMCLAQNWNNGSTGTVDVSVISRSGSTLTLGTTTTIESGLEIGLAEHQISLVQLGTYTYWLGYFDSSTSDTWVGRLLNRDGTVLTAYGSELTGTSASPDLIPFGIYTGPKKLCLVYPSTTDSNSYAKIVDMSNNFAGTIGVITTSVAQSASALAILSGENSSVTGLTTGTEYYADLDGSLTTEALGGTKRIGVATSATKIVVQA